ncbi:serine/threonine protein kinase, partial [Klebsiella aerogenes]
LKLNGEPHNTQPATNGFASLKLAPGHYEITLQGNGQTREQTLEIAKPGTWLINPSG